jgi:Xaa-Pro dipeptidase
MYMMWAGKWLFSTSPMTLILYLDSRQTKDHGDDDEEEERLSTFLVDRPLEANMVLTVEPGVYFNDSWISTWTQCPGYEHYYNMDRIRQYSVVGGIRIEDTIVITDTGHENLTTAPKKVEDIEKIMASGAHRDNTTDFDY